MASRPVKKTLPALEEPDQVDPEVLTIEARHDAAYWLDEVERRTGYPFWAWIGGCICLFMFLALLSELAATFRKPDPAKT